MDLSPSSIFFNYLSEAQMDYDLNGYNPFKSHYYLSEDGSEEIDTELMNEYDWEEWLDSLSLDV